MSTELIDMIRDAELKYYIVMEGHWLGLEDQLVMAKLWEGTPRGEADIEAVEEKIAEHDAEISALEANYGKLI